MSAKDDIDDSSAPLVEHLAELRNRLIWSVGGLSWWRWCFASSWPSRSSTSCWLRSSRRCATLGNPNPVMQYTAPQEYFFTLMHISMVGGLMVSFPVIAYQLWRFVAPGLYRSEKAGLPAVPDRLAGAVRRWGAFAHFVVTPMAMQFFLGLRRQCLDV
jgi:sec-independent protein translocase protein TatC